MSSTHPAIKALKKLKVLTFDTETSYMKARPIWRLGEQVVRHDQLEEGFHYVKIICITYKWLHEKEVHALTWDKNQNCDKMVEEFDKVLQQADIVIGQNHESFDIKHLNTQRMMNDLPPLAGWNMVTEDTKKMVKRFFNMPSAALDYLSKYVLKTGGKVKMDMQDWIDIQEGEPAIAAKKLKKMVHYGKKDVKDTEKAFIKMFLYCKPKTNMATHVGKDLACIRCGGSNLTTLRLSYTNTQIMQEYRCGDCKMYACRAPIGKNNVPGKKGRV